MQTQTHLNRTTSQPPTSVPLGNPGTKTPRSPLASPIGDEGRRIDAGHAVTADQPESPQHDTGIQEPVCPSGQRLDWGLWTDYRLQTLRTAAPLLVHDLAWTFSLMTLSAWTLTNLAGLSLSWNFPSQVAAWLVLQTALMRYKRMYPGIGTPPVTEIRSCFRSVAFTTGAILITNALVGELPPTEAFAILLGGALTAAAVPTSRQLFRQRLVRDKSWGGRVLLAGKTAQVQKLASTMVRDASSGLRPIGYVVPTGEFTEARQRDPRVLGTIDDIVAVARFHRAPIIAMDASVSTSDPTEASLAKRLAFLFPSVLWMDSRVGYHPDRDPVGVYHHREVAPFFSLCSRMTKRSIDIGLSALGLIALSPLMLMIAAWIRLRDPGPIFYASRRVGRFGKPLNMWKFRTMVIHADDLLKDHLAKDPEAAEQWTREQKLRNDPRIIPGVGKFLRSSSLDELPQLWNVLRGEMSLVGPRPLPPGEVKLYGDQYFPYSNMWPGITGLWQVSGRNDLSFADRVFLVHHYAMHWSIWLDVWILLKTPMIVMTRRGAY